MVIHGYKSAIQTIKHINESPNHLSGEPDHPLPPAAPTVPLPTTTVISKRLSDTSSLFSVSSQQGQGSPERGLPANIQSSSLLHYAEPPLAMVATVFSFDNRYAASAISNTLDLLASFFAPFLDKFSFVVLHFIVVS